MKHKQTFIAVSLLSLMLTACSGNSGISGFGGGGGSTSAPPLAALNEEFTTFLGADQNSAATQRLIIARNIATLARNNAVRDDYGVLQSFSSENLQIITARRTSLSISSGTIGDIGNEQTASLAGPTITINGRDYVSYPVTHLPLQQEAVIYGTSIDGIVGTDNYHAFGYWLVGGNPNGAFNESTQVVAFSLSDDGNRTPASYLTTPASATYSGVALGQYVDGRDASSAQRSFTGDLSLTTTFGAGNRPISGAVNNIKYGTAGFGDAPSTTTINLGSTNINNQTGGFFSGATTSAGAAGRWGGQFYGPNAEIVGGTFGVASSDQSAWFGAFSGEKQ